MDRRAIRCGLLFALAFLPLALLAFRHTLSVPSYDQITWNIVDIAEAARNGRLSWRVFSVPHNEHQIFATKAVIALNAALFGWWQPLDSLMSAGLIAASAALFAALVGRQYGTWAAIATVVIMAALNQWRNVTLGFMINHGAVLLLAVGMALHAGRRRLSPVALALLALLATVTSANGLLLWFIGAVLLAAQLRRRSTVAERAKLGLYLLAGMLTIGWYVFGLPGVRTTSRGPLAFASSLLVVLGGPLAAIDRAPVLLYAGGALVLASSLAFLFRWAGAELGSSEPAVAERQRPLAVLVLFCLGSAAMIAMAREGDMLLDPKYGTTINPLYAAAALNGWSRRQARLGARLRSAVVAGVFLLASALSLPQAYLSERLDRAVVVAQYVEAVAREGLVVGGEEAWGWSDVEDAGLQMQRLDHLNLLRPSLRDFAGDLRDLLPRLRSGPVAPGPTMAASILADGPRRLIEVVGDPGVDRLGHPPDAVLLFSAVEGAAPSVAVMRVAKSAARDYRGRWWDKRSLGYLSDQFELSRSRPQAPLVLVGVWLESRTMRILGRLEGPRTASSGAP